MKKISALVFIVGIGIVIAFSVSIPIPDVNPLRDDQPNSGVPSDTMETSDGVPSGGSSGVRLETGSFVFPYYAGPNQTRPTWIFHGAKGEIVQDRGNIVNVRDPRILYFPERDRNEERTKDPRTVQRVRITGRTGRKKAKGTAHVKTNVRVQTDRGARLRTEELRTNFETGRLYTPSNTSITLSRPGLRLNGTGFTGTPRLATFTVRTNNELVLNASRLKQRTPSDRPPSGSTTYPRYYITCSGPIKARQTGGTNDEPERWKLSLFRNVSLHRVRPGGSFRQRSRVLHIYFSETADGASGESTGNERNDPSGTPGRSLEIRRMEARGQVHVTHPEFDIRTEHLTVREQNDRRVIHLQGRQQRIRLRSSGQNRGGESNGTTPTASDSSTLVTVSGTGRIIRPRTDEPAEEEPSEPAPSFSGVTKFSGRVHVRRRKGRLHARKLNMTFALPDETETNRAETVRTAETRSLDARGNVLSMRETLASTGDRLTWSRTKQITSLTGKPDALITDLENNLCGRTIRMNQKRHRLVARGEASTTLQAGGNRWFRLIGMESGSASEKSGQDRTRATVHGQTITFNLSAGNDQLQSFRAQDEVRIDARDVRARGETFVFNRIRSKASLLGGQGFARIEQDRHRALANAFHVYVDRRDLVLKGRKRIRLSGLRDNRAPDESGKRTPPGNLEAYTGAPAIIHRAEGILQILGPVHLKRSAGRMRCRRLLIRFNPETGDPSGVRASGTVLVNDRKGSAYGDFAGWHASSNRMEIRGQPFAVVRHDNQTTRYEIINMWNNWERVRGERYKWRSKGTVEYDSK